MFERTFFFFLKMCDKAKPANEWKGTEREMKVINIYVNCKAKLVLQFRDEQKRFWDDLIVLTGNTKAESVITAISPTGS